MTLSQKWTRIGGSWEILFQFIGNTFNEAKRLIHIWLKASIRSLWLLMALPPF